MADSIQQHHCTKRRKLGVVQILLICSLWLNRCDVTAQSTTAWAIPYRTAASSEFVASAMMYDAEGDRIYVTGRSIHSAVENVDSDDDATEHEDGFVLSTSNRSSSDCFLGILQVPRRITSNNSLALILEEENGSDFWIRRFDRIGTEQSQESCSGIQTFRQGNERKVYLIGHSLLGPSLLESQQNWYGPPPSTNSSKNTTNNTVVYGLVLDVSWYNGRVNTGYLMATKPVEYPITVASAGGDLYVASLLSQFGDANLAYALHQTPLEKENGSILDLTNDGSPKYGENFALHLQRLGQRSFSMDDLLTLPKPSNDSATPASFLGFKTPSFRQFQLAATSHIMPNKTANITVSTSALNSTSRSNSTNTISIANMTDGMDLSNDNTTLSKPPSYDQYRYVVEPLVERWGREFYAQDDPTTTLNSVQVSSMLLVTRTRTTTLVDSTIDDDNKSNGDDARPFDDDTVTVERPEPVLIVAGNTRGSSLVIGGRPADATTNVFSKPGAALHGFVTSLHPATGVMLRTLAVQATASSHRPTVQILGLCHAASKTDFVYVVGMTDGTLNGNASQQTTHVGVYQAFIQRLDVSTFSVIWTKQLSAAIFPPSTAFGSRPGSAYGVACAVTSDGMQVYLGGTVRDGAAITLDNGVTNATSSFGLDDIFIAQFSAEVGSLNYVRQIGSRYDDVLATGVSLVADKYGNAIVLGNTRRSFLDPMAMDDDNGIRGNSHVILLSVDRRNGQHVDLRDRVESTDSPTDLDNGFAPTDSPVQGDEFSLSSKIGLLYILIPALLTVASSLICWWTFSRRRRSEERIIARYLRSVEKIPKKQCPDPSVDMEQAKLCHNDEDLDTECSVDEVLDETMHFCSRSRAPSSLNGDDGIATQYSDSLLRHADDDPRFIPDASNIEFFQKRRKRRMMQGYNEDSTNLSQSCADGSLGDAWARWWEP
jgi:hypothetical protein